MTRGGEDWLDGVRDKVNVGEGRQLQGGLEGRSVDSPVGEGARVELGRKG
jgi:hypothetical protein